MGDNMSIEIQGMRGRYFCFCIVVRVNQIEVAPGINVGHDERHENTVENLVKYRQAICDAIPNARITIAFSHEALSDKSPNFVALREKAKEYHFTYGDDITYMLGAYFSGAYSPRKAINSHVDDAIHLLKSFMGKDYLPLSIVGGFVPSDVMEHIASIGIHVVQGVIFSQYAVDNQDGDGSMCYPYYPSKEHFCKPAQSKADFIDTVVLDGWTVDFVNATYAGVKKVNGEACNSRMGCGPIETVRLFGQEVGIDIMVKSAAQMLEESYALNGNFGYAASIWELCLIEENGYHRMGMDGNTVTSFFKKMKQTFPDVKIVPFGEFGNEFRKVHKDNENINYVFKHRGIGIGGSLSEIQISWYMNSLFRLAIKTDLKTGEQRVIDFTDYTKPAFEPPDSNYREGVVFRNWSLLGDINQKGLREQDKPIPLEELNAHQKELIYLAEKKFNLKIL
ncbi:MAG: DUF3863 domain-containing protein [Clostridia bacterium]|nr:DUF3863 domain-containing protein [Clostridia bacterium]